MERVLVITKEGKYVSEMGNHKHDADDYLHNPTGVAVDGQQVFVADSEENCIKVFTKEGGQFIGEVAGVGTLRPYDLAVNGGMLYVVDTARQCIAVFT